MATTAAASTGDRLERILSALRAGGGRVTSSRRAVVRALLEGPQHATADELGSHVRTVLPDIDQSTVYRVLNALEAVGAIHHVHLGHGAAVYHLSEDTHAHLVCDGCGAVTELPTETFERLAGDVRRRTGYSLDRQHFSMSGTCRACQAQAG